MMISRLSKESSPQQLPFSKSHTIIGLELSSNMPKYVVSEMDLVNDSPLEMSVSFVAVASGIFLKSMG